MLTPKQIFLPYFSRKSWGSKAYTGMLQFSYMNNVKNETFAEYKVTRRQIGHY